MNLSRFADALTGLEATGRRGEMVSILSRLFEDADDDERGALVYLVQGRLAPPFRGMDFGMGERLLVRSIARTYETDEDAVQAAYREAGDLGTAAERLAGDRSPGAVPVPDAFRALEAIARSTGSGSQERKVGGVAELLARVGAVEARYLVRIVQGRLRLGVGDQTLLEAIAAGALGDAGKKAAVERAYNLRADLADIARIAYREGERGLARIEPEPGVPIRPALAQRVRSLEELSERLEEIQAEPKYDGFRLQLHRDADRVRAYSRRLEDVTGMFPELADALRRQLRAGRAILEGEALVYDPDTGEFPPFQVTMTRKRKHRVREMAERFPLRLFAFDLLYADGETLVERPLRDRRRRLERELRTEPDSPVALAEARLTRQPAEVAAFFEEMVARGLEGILAKRPDSPYPAGARSFDWIKLKRDSRAHLGDTVDVVIVGYLAGRGKRAPLGIGSLLGAVYDPDEDRFRTVAKVGSGPSDREWKELKAKLDAERSRRRPRRLDSLIEPDVWVEPRFVVAVQADEITRSPSHTCGREDGEPGYALRFPRMVDGIRADKAAEDATTEDEVLRMYRMQGVPRGPVP